MSLSRTGTGIYVSGKDEGISGGPVFPLERPGGTAEATEDIVSVSYIVPEKRNNATLYYKINCFGI
jgi:hypothetical protein